ncbi:hypothetical protein JOC77_000826 [Peribacillus deserti]|uniref:Uncharacterized protein n=1 Tax=Peribacillus deserti TaxID=673318 RepID=A0ABS2QGK9_9BACI|nr:hypothetical protein [Peribacillus deserti]MBM7691421.1 hypothetical protein [Peribacillus deserti]
MEVKHEKTFIKLLLRIWLGQDMEKEINNLERNKDGFNNDIFMFQLQDSKGENLSRTPEAAANITAEHENHIW